MRFNVEVEIELVEPTLDRAEEAAEFIAAKVREMGPEVVSCDVAVVIEKRQAAEGAFRGGIGGIGYAAAD